MRYRVTPPYNNLPKVSDPAGSKSPPCMLCPEGRRISWHWSRFRKSVRNRFILAELGVVVVVLAVSALLCSPLPLLLLATVFSNFRKSSETVSFAADLASTDKFTMIGLGIDLNQRNHVIASSCLSLPFFCAAPSSSPGRYNLILSNAFRNTKALPSSIQLVALEAWAPASLPMASRVRSDWRRVVAVSVDRRVNGSSSSLLSAVSCLLFNSSSLFVSVCTVDSITSGLLFADPFTGAVAADNCILGILVLRYDPP
mmetsp:Transcript_6679/g.15177  ORF Transcript_6679/g.15177 Transcript_6679/m.15177 type:complete len:256 (-) Transcript_6679:246-1013(-)